MAQQFNPQNIKKRISVLVFLKGAAAPLVMYVEKPEELMKIRECDAVVLCVKAAGKNGKRIERCLEQLARQDIAVTATVLVEADEKLINAYYGSKK